jgi:hypothetical protein
MVSCLLRLLRTLRFSEPLGPLKSISLWLKSPYFDVLRNQIFEQNDEISSKILPSFRTEAVGDRDITFNQIQGSTVKCPLRMNIQIPFI